MLLAFSIYLVSLVLSILILRYGKKHNIKDSRKLHYFLCFVPGINTLMIVVTLLSAIYALGDWIEEQ